MVKRFDFMALMEPHVTPQGFLRAPARVAKVGVFPYRQPDGTIRRELKSREELFKADSLATMVGLPVTYEHKGGMVTPENAKALTVGFTGERIDTDEKFVSTTLTVMDKAVIDSVKAGTREISLGYFCELDFSPGVYDGQPYDAVQRNIVYNHLTITQMARLGSEIRMKLDSADAELVDPETKTEKEDSVMNEKIKIGGKEFEVSKEVAEAFRADSAARDTATSEVQTKLDSATKELGEMKAKVGEVEKEKSALQGKLDSATEDLKKAKEVRQDSSDEKKIQERVKSRVRLEKIATSCLKKEVMEKLDSMDDKSVKVEVIKSQFPTAKLDGKDEAYIDARFDHVAEALEASGTVAQSMGSALLSRERTDSEVDAESARKRQTERTLGAWKEPLSTEKKQ